MLKNHEGQRVPSVVLKTRKNGEFVDTTSDEIFKGRTVIVFSLPGAFTPTCSSTHLPRFNELASVFKENGVDDIVCMSVNDAFVMKAWKDVQNAEHILMLADGDASFTKALGLDFAPPGMGVRSKRFSMLVKDNEVVEFNLEEPGKFEVSDVDTLLSQM